MATTIPKDGKDCECPQCNLVPSAALLAGQASIPSQRKAVTEFLVLEAMDGMATTACMYFVSAITIIISALVWSI